MAVSTQEQRTSGEGDSAARPGQARGWLWSLLVGLGILAVIGSIVPRAGTATDLHTWTQILMFCVLAQSWNFMGGFTGYAAFGNVAFFGIGAYSVGIAVTSGDPLWHGLVIGAILAATFALLLGLPVLRLKGHYFAIATLGVGEALRELAAARNVGAPGGEMALPLPELSNTDFFYAFLALSTVCLLITTWLTRSKFGYALVAIREGEPAAAALGIATHRYKVGAFVLSAIPTAVAGGLYADWLTGFDPPTVFGVGISVEMVLLTFLGGAGTILGPLVGAIVFEYGSFRLLATGFSAHSAVLGLAIIIVTIFLPQGLVRLAQGLIRLPRRRTPGTNRLREGVRNVRRYLATNGV
jgi:branched-chain amino acid transport system permease protein